VFYFGKTCRRERRRDAKDPRDAPITAIDLPAGRARSTRHLGRALEDINRDGRSTRRPGGRAGN